MPPQTETKQENTNQSILFYLLYTLLTSIVLLGAFYLFTSTNTTKAQTQPPATLNYQGKVLENNTSVTSSKQMGFVLYDSQTGGNILYTANGTKTNTSTISVTPTQGIFNVELGAGSTNSLDPQIFQNNSSVYLQVYIEGTKLTPRKKLSSQPFSLNSQYLMGYEAKTSPTNTKYVPVSDSRGEFTFKRVTVNETTTLAKDKGGVSIGTTSPETKLDVAGTSTVRSNLFVGTTTEDITTSTYTLNGDDAYIADLLGVGDELFVENQVNVGTSSLHLSGDTSGGELRMDNGPLTVDATKQLKLNTTNNQDIITGSGNIGIGETNPSEALHVGAGGNIQVDASGYNVSTASFTQSTSTRDGVPRGMAFNDDGTRMYEIGGFNDEIYEYSLSTPFDVSTASFTQSTSTQDGSPAGIAFNNEGTKMYEIGYSSDKIYEYSLSNAYDISTASFTQSTSTQAFTPNGVAFNNDGTKMYDIDSGVDKIHEYSLSTPFDVSTASFTQSTSTRDGVPRGMAFNDDGTRMYEAGQDGDKIYEYSLSTAFDVSTASFTRSTSSRNGKPQGIAFNNDGAKMYEVGRVDGKIYEYSLASTGGNLTLGGNADIFGTATTTDLIAKNSLTLNGDKRTSWQDLVSSYSGWTTSSGKIYPKVTSSQVLVGTSNTSTTNSIFETEGSGYISDNLRVGSTTEDITTSTFNLNGDDAYIQDQLGVGDELFVENQINVGTSSLKLTGDTSGGEVRMDNGPLAIDATGTLNLNTNSNQNIITGSGNVGIGESNPSEALHVSGNGLVKEEGSYDVDSASFFTEKSGFASIAAVIDVQFNDTGSRLFVAGDSGVINRYSLGTNYNINSIADTNNPDQSFSLSTSNEIGGLAFNNQGDKLFIADDENNEIKEYSLSSAYDISNPTLNSSTSTQDSRPRDITFNNDGSKMYTSGFGSGGNIYEYTLSSNFEISTASFSNSIISEDSVPTGVSFNDEGTKLFEAGNNNQEIYQYPLSSPFDISTISNNPSKSRPVSVSPGSVTFDDIGSRMYVGVFLSSAIRQYSINTNGGNLTVDKNLNVADTATATDLVANTSITLNGDKRTSWQDLVSSYSGWTTSSGKIYPKVTSSQVLVGTSNTSTTNSIFETEGSGYISDNLRVGSSTENITTSTFNLNGDDAYIADLLGVGDELFVENQVNVGTSSLHLSGDTSGGELRMDNGPLTVDSAEDLNLNTNRDQNIITGGGKVGVGTASPQEKMHVAGKTSTSGSPWSLSFVKLTSDNPLNGDLHYGVEFGDSGSKMFVPTIDSNTFASELRQFNLSNPWTISSGVTLTSTFPAVQSDFTITDVSFKSDGSKMFLASGGNGSSSSTIHEVNLDTAWNISSTTIVTSTNITSQVPSVSGIDFRVGSGAGSEMFVTSLDDNKVYKYSLGSDWTLTNGFTLTNSTTVSTTELFGLAFKDDGAKIFLNDTSESTVGEDTLSSSWDISNISLTNTTSVADSDSSTGVTFRSDGSDMFVSGFSFGGGGGTAIYKYCLAECSSTGGNLKVEGSGEINKNLRVGISSPTNPKITTSSFDLDGNDAYVDDQLGVANEIYMQQKGVSDGISFNNVLRIANSSSVPEIRSYSNLSAGLLIDSGSGRLKLNTSETSTVEVGDDLQVGNSTGNGELFVEGNSTIDGTAALATDNGERVSVGGISPQAKLEVKRPVGANISNVDNLLEVNDSRLSNGSVITAGTSVSSSVKNIDSFEDQTLDPFVGSGSYPWTVTSSDSNDGTYSAVSTNEGITNTVSEMKLTTTTSKIEFDYQVDASLFDQDEFRFYVDGNQKFAESEATLWETASFDLEAGSHTFKWEFETDSDSSNSEKAFVDNVKIYKSTSDRKKYVSVNTTSQNYQLTVDGSANISEGINLNGANKTNWAWITSSGTIRTRDTTKQVLVGKSNTSTTSSIFEAGGDALVEGDLTVGSPSNPVLRTDSGKVGINTSSPEALLDIEGGRDGVQTSSTLSVSGTSRFENGLTEMIGSVQQPKPEGNITSSSAKLGAATDLYVRGNYAYVTSYDDDALQILDISDPSNPQAVGSIDNTAPNTQLDDPQSVYVSGKYAYVATDISNTGLQIIDISNPADPKAAGNINNSEPNTKLQGPESVHISGNYAYIVSTGDDALQIVNVSDPFNPTPAGNIDDTANNTQLNGPRYVRISGNYAYIASTGSNALQIIDISDPSNPVPAGSIDNSDANTKLDDPNSLDISGNYAYITAFTSDALQIVNISDSTNPTAVGNIDNSEPNTRLDGALPVQVSGDYAYVGTSRGTSSLQIIDISTPSTPSPVTFIDNSESNVRLEDPAEIQISGNILSLNSDDALQTINVGSAKISNLDIGSAEISDLQTMNKAKFNEGIDVRGGLSVGSNGLMLSGDFGMSSPSSTQSNFNNLTFANTALFESNASSTNSSSFVFKSKNNSNTLRIKGPSGSSDYGGKIVFGTNEFTGSDPYLQETPTGSLYIDGGGGVSLGATNNPFTADETFHVNGSICVTDDQNCDVDPGAGEIAAKSSLITGADLAEIYPSTQDLTTGELVTLDSTASSSVKRTSGSYAKDLVGIVSTDPGVQLGGSATTGTYPIALSGRVPTLVTDKGGDIQVGDPITSSDVPGVGMKATSTARIVGYALEPFTSTGTSTISVYVSPDKRYEPSDFKVTRSGRVGIGTTSPDTKLDVQGTATAERFRSTSSSVMNKLAGGLSVGPKGFMLDQGDFTMTNPSSSIFTTNTLNFDSTALFNSQVTSTDSNAFVFDTENQLQTNSTTYLASIRNNSDPVFSVASNGDVHAGGTMYANSFNTGGNDPGDLAEEVPIEGTQEVEPGDVLSVSEQDVDTYKKSEQPYSTSVSGVVSTDPSITIGGTTNTNTAVMAMVGRVPTKVTTENGPIERGDLLVSASKPAHAMKYDASEDEADKTAISSVGIALEEFKPNNSNTTTGKIMTLVKSGWVSNYNKSITKVKEEITQVAKAKGLDPNQDKSKLTIGTNENDKLAYTDTGQLDLAGHNIINVSGIRAAENKWAIDTNGRFKTNVETSEGEKSLYTIQSDDSAYYTFFDTDKLEDGEKEIRFKDYRKDIIDDSYPIQVNVTLNDPANGVYVSDKDGSGFTVEELGDGESNASFSWTVIARRVTKDSDKSIKPHPGCTNPRAKNYDPTATEDDGSCKIGGCVDVKAENYDSTATYGGDIDCVYDKSKVIKGCTAKRAKNYDPNANLNDDSCKFNTPTASTTSTDKSSTSSEEDNEDPEITLLGGKEIKIDKGTEYNDAGVEVEDNLDNDPEVEIKVNGIETEEVTIDTSLTNTYNISYKAIDDNENESEVATRTVKVVSEQDKEEDTTKPELTLNGAKEVTITEGETYEDKGATAKDNKDGDITDKIQKEGTVNTSKPDKYELKYSVTDKAGNTANTSRFVTVEANSTTTDSNTTTQQEDTTKPDITINGDTQITLKVGHSYTDQGAEATDNKDGDITDQIKTTNNVDTTTAGTYTVTYEVTDSAGNKATTERTVTVEESKTTDDTDSSSNGTSSSGSSGTTTSSTTSGSGSEKTSSSTAS